MATNSKVETVRRMADEIPATTADDLAALLAVPDDAIDTSDIPEQSGTRCRLRRDENGSLPKRRSLLRDAIVGEMMARGMTAYALWKEARTYCPTISETAVGEFLKGQRSIGVEYLDALMNSLKLTVNLPSVPAVITPGPNRLDRPNQLTSKIG